MSNLTIALRPHGEQTGLNLRRWDELLADPVMAQIEGRIETDRHGQIIMSPPPAPRHGRFQSEIVHLLRTLMQHGKPLTECPISTADGVKAADVAWASPECWGELGNRVCFVRCSEICVEVLSPRNTNEEIREKMALYFDAGAMEVWVCGTFGEMSFFGPQLSELQGSGLCPGFPRVIEF
jgi:Uma2 family endonuclease